MPRLSCLKPGTRFRVPELDLTATLLMVNECRARVRIDNGATEEIKADQPLQGQILILDPGNNVVAGVMPFYEREVV
jgi:hypothetical protein